MSNFPLMIDVFEGSGLLDLPKLKESNVQYVMVRLGAYSRLGGLMGNRKDDLFDKQWALLDTDPWFKKIIYIPYNPWISWQRNLSFLLDNLPKNCYGVELDVENKRILNYTSKTYAAEFAEYYNHIPQNIQKIIYTGEAFLPYLSNWPKGNYSWAQYPYALRPSDSVYWTWDYLREKLSKFTGPYNQNKAPSRVNAWQFTGDKVILSGSEKGMDVYAWLDTQEELDKLFGSNNIPPEPPPPTEKSRYVGSVLPTTFFGLQVRQSPVTGMKVGKLNPNQEFEGDILVTVQNDKWLNITKPINGWISLKYCKWIDNSGVVIPPPNESKVAIPGAFKLLSDLDLGIKWEDRFENAKLLAYPATINLNGGKGQVQLSASYLTQLKRINTLAQWNRMWTNEHGYHNKPHGEIGRIQQVSFAHSNVWVTGEDNDYYYVDVYYNDEVCPDLVANYDEYRINIFSIMSKNDAQNNGGIFYDDTGYIKTLMIANNRTEKLKIEKKYCKSLISLPKDCKVKTTSGDLNIREVPINGKVVGKYKNNDIITVLEVVKPNHQVWLKTNKGFVAAYLTDLDI